MDINIIKKEIVKYYKYDKNNHTLIYTDKFWFSYSLNMLDKLGYKDQDLIDLLINLKEVF